MFNCPVCRNGIYQSIKTKSKVGTDSFETAQWFFCKCGCVFNAKEINTLEVFNEEYRKSAEEMKSKKERCEYYFYTYGSFIEELTYGRKALDVGYCLPYAINQLRGRGWLATGIDLIPDQNFHTGDFLDFDFGRERFDFIKMTDFLQCVKNPLLVLRKAYRLLNPNGVLLISTPDTDLIRDNFFPEWGHWNANESRQYFNERILREMLSKCGQDLSGGFEVKLIHRDMSKRFPSWNNIHLIVQKSERKTEE
jgi:SAM-dependent methyltransferase